MSVYACMRRSVINALREMAILVSLLVLVGCTVPTIGDGNGSNDIGSDAAPGPESATDFGTITTSFVYDGTVNGDTYDVGYDADWYAFTIGTNETVRIDTSELSAPFDTELWLYNVNTTLADVDYSWESPYGNDLIANDDDGAPSGYSSIVQVLDAGTYVIRVSYFSESSAAAGDYTIDLTIE